MHADSNIDESPLSWETWWPQYEKVYQDARDQPAALRHGLTVLRVSEFATQFYCEQQLDLRLLLRAERFREWERRTSSGDVEGRSDPIAVGVRGHEAIAGNEPERPVEDVWRDVIAGDSVRLHDPLLLGRYEEIVLAGHPDVIVFSEQIPQLVIEYKFSAKGIPSAQHHSQANLYCYLLEGMGFDVSHLHYVLGIFPPNCEDRDALRNSTDLIVESFPFGRAEIELTKGKARLNASPYDRSSSLKELKWASGYWRGIRDAVPTKVAWKCRACSAKKICHFSLA